MYQTLRWTIRIIAASALFVMLVAMSNEGCHAQFGFGGPPGGGPNAPDVEILKDFDADEDGVLNKVERKKARASLKKNTQTRRRGPGGPRGGGQVSGKAGPRVKPDEVEQFPNAKLYDPTVLRTLFLTFDNKDWETELSDFKPTDVEVPATLVVDGKKYPNVGVSFRGASSYFSISPGLKRSLNLSIDYVDDDQRLYGYKTLNLLNCNGDATMMSTYLYSDIASQKIAVPKANFVKVVINGRSWGIYANVQQFNKEFVKENFGTKKGARWKVSGSPQGDGGLRYTGTDVKDYQARYEIKSKDKKESWDALIELCRTLNETPLDELETKLDPILDIDGALWFLALDVASVNSDGYWTRASDYNIYKDPDGKFHILPHDMNEAFRAGHGGPGGPGGPGGGPPNGGLFGIFGGGPPGGPAGQRFEPRGGGPEGQRPGGRPEFSGPPGGQERGGRGGRNGRSQRGGRGGFGPGGPGGRGPGGPPGAGGFELDPMVGMDNDRFPLRTRLLAVPKFKQRYLQYVKLIAEEHLAWEKMGPKVEQAKKLIADEVAADTRKLFTDDAFKKATDDSEPTAAGSLKEFAEKRSEYLLNLPAIKAVPSLKPEATDSGTAK